MIFNFLTQGFFIIIDLNSFKEIKKIDLLISSSNKLIMLFFDVSLVPMTSTLSSIKPYAIDLSLI